LTKLLPKFGDRTTIAADEQRCQVDSSRRPSRTWVNRRRTAPSVTAS